MPTLQQMKYFRELAKTEQLTQTAESLCIAQTTLSNTIINLEKQLGTQLFDRVGRNIQLNEVGKIYLSYVNVALNAIDDADKAISDYTGRSYVPVSVAMTSSHIWQDLIKNFTTTYSDYSLHQSECSRDLFRTLLIDQKVDFVFTGTNDFLSTGLEHEVLYTDDIYLCVPKTHPLAKRTSISLSEAAGETFIDLPQSSAFRHFCDEMFAKAGIQHKATLECDYMLRGKLIESGFGVALTTNISYWKNIMSKDSVYLLITDDYAVREISIFWNPKRYLGKAAKDFKSFALSMYRKEF